MMIMQTGKEPDPYWNDSARTVLTAFIAFVCACEDNPEKRNLDTVRDLLSSRQATPRRLRSCNRSNRMAALSSDLAT